MNEDLLSQLRDIHAAPDVPWWPPAPGWWILALVVLVLLVLLGRFAVARRRVRQRRKQRLNWVDFLNVMVNPEEEPQAYLSMLNRIFKLVAMEAFPGEHCAAMTGSEWVGFLTRKLESEPSVDALDVLANGPFDPRPEYDPDTVSALARTWILRHG